MPALKTTPIAQPSKPRPVLKTGPAPTPVRVIGNQAATHTKLIFAAHDADEGSGYHVIVTPHKTSEATNAIVNEPIGSNVLQQQSANDKYVETTWGISKGSKTSYPWAGTPAQQALWIKQHTAYTAVVKQQNTNNAYVTSTFGIKRGTTKTTYPWTGTVAQQKAWIADHKAYLAALDANKSGGNATGSTAGGSSGSSSSGTTSGSTGATSPTVLAQLAQDAGAASQPLGSQLDYAPASTTSTTSGGSDVFLLGLLIVAGVGGYLWWKHKHKHSAPHEG
jgi:uncharacterized protein YecT (DUF1311 family)